MRRVKIKRLAGIGASVRYKLRGGLRSAPRLAKPTLPSGPTARKGRRLDVALCKAPFDSLFCWKSG